eukprot:gnl/Spiro4/2900_TR1429_c0_g1_i1.p1 gnl/Spiro4/2900_TR1429_c0_g1~~gnl/Spiro4/2900_TR1429_c0_g1_i1.p1  ORF type:complete len:607 (+),score=81.59 gnl/Spiro4/2900_TR1429_c0_g1_i1:125-1945(+)
MSEPSSTGRHTHTHAQSIQHESSQTTSRARLKSLSEDDDLQNAAQLETNEKEENEEENERQTELTEVTETPDIFASPEPVLLIPGVKTWRQKLFTFISEPGSGRYAQLWGALILVLVFIAIIAFMLQTIESISDNPAVWFSIETIVTFFFSLELSLRAISWPYMCRDFFLDFFNIFDILAVLPYYVEIIIAATNNVSPAGSSGSTVGGLAAVRVLRLARILRLFKAGARFTKVRLAVQALYQSKEGILLLGALMLMSSVFFSSLVYFAETSLCDLIDGVWVYQDVPGVDSLYINKPTQFQNVPISMWWCVCTLTTVGYGDFVPVTPWGRVVGAFCMYVGVLVLAFPITIISSNLKLAYDEQRRKDEIARRELRARKFAQRVAVEEDADRAIATPVMASVSVKDLANFEQYIAEGKLSDMSPAKFEESKSDVIPTELSHLHFLHTMDWRFPHEVLALCRRYNQLVGEQLYALESTTERLKRSQIFVAAILAAMDQRDRGSTVGGVAGTGATMRGRTGSQRWQPTPEAELTEDPDNAASQPQGYSSASLSSIPPISVAGSSSPPFFPRSGSRRSGNVPAIPAVVLSPPALVDSTSSTARSETFDNPER